MQFYLVLVYTKDINLRMNCVQSKYAEKYSNSPVISKRFVAAIFSR